MIRTLLFLLALAIPGMTFAESIRQTTEGRFWLLTPASQKPPTDVEVSSGTATPAPWEKDPAVRERHLDILFPVRWWDWKEVKISFTPPEDGTVDLVLCGPWEESKPGEVFRKEVLWDEISATGTDLENGGFEDRENGALESWKPLYGNPAAPDAWPLAGAAAMKGKAVGASWQNRPLAQTLTVKAGKRVTVTLHARAATPPGFVSPARLGTNTPAHIACAALKRGVNLGNCWDAPPPYTWGIRYTEEDIDRIAAEGFDHIRVPVAWSHHLSVENGTTVISPKLLQDLEPVLRRALDKKLRVLLDWHHFDDLTTNPEANRKRFIDGWAAISNRFKSWPDGLYFELLNEPKDALTTEVLNDIHRDAIATIRKSNPTRILVATPGKWGDPRELDKLRLPDTDDRIIITFHCYEPFFFTHQGAGWVNLEPLKGVVYPGPPPTPLALPEALREHGGLRAFIEGYNTLPKERNPCSAAAVTELMDLAKEWSTHFGRPVHLGEFGAFRAADEASRSRYVKDVRTLAESRSIPWTLWDWKAGFAYWDSETNRPLLKAALFE